MVRREVSLLVGLMGEWLVPTVASFWRGYRDSRTCPSWRQSGVNDSLEYLLTLRYFLTYLPFLFPLPP